MDLWGGLNSAFKHLGVIKYYLPQSKYAAKLLADCWELPSVCFHMLELTAVGLSTLVSSASSSQPRVLSLI